MLILALSVAGCAAYFSVWGLSQLFAGASTAVIIMASVLEVSKVVVTTALHRYWSNLARGLKIYLTISVGILMIITSTGIYGFLSNAYQKTANKLEIHEGEVSVLDNKKLLFEKNITDNQKIIDTKNKRIEQLTSLRNTQENRMDNAKNSWSKDKVRGDINLATKEIQKLSDEIDVLNSKNAVLSDSISKYSIKVVELESGSDVAAEVGPLKYISELTGKPMASVVNYLILLLIFVFDPLAIALVLITNRVFELQGEINPLEPDVKKTPIEESITINEVPEPIVNEVKEEIIEEVIPEEIVAEEVKEEIKEEEVKPTPIIKHEPVIPTGKVELQDIKEIKESNRGFSVNVPDPKPNKTNNTIERLGSNKIVKDGNSNKIFFKRD